MKTIDEIIKDLGDPTTFADGIAGLTEKIAGLENQVTALTDANTKLTAANTSLYLRATGQAETATTADDDPEDKFDSLVKKMKGEE